MAPGDVIKGSFEVENIGSLPLCFRVKPETSWYLFEGGDYPAVVEITKNRTGGLNAGESRMVKYTVSLPLDAGNDYQNKQGKLKFIVDAVQKTHVDCAKYWEEFDGNGGDNGNGNGQEETYTVTFNSNGGSAVDPITGVTEGETVTLPADPTKEGHTFLGWFIDEETPFTAETPVTEDITVYAKWEAEEVIPDWVQPVWPAPGYSKGAVVKHDGSVWESLYYNNYAEPPGYRGKHNKYWWKKLYDL
ncbi:MAG TPA: InlB B-repeat-containing protein [Firmicutes bacterium]|nr:InlB B-repeat-containing protein [Bacillota bacterium]